MAWLHSLGFIHFYYCFHCPLLPHSPPPSLHETGKRSAWGGKGPGKEESGWGAAKRKTVKYESCKEKGRADRSDGERARTREQRTAGGRGLNRAGDRVLPSMPFTPCLLEAKQENPKARGKPGVAQVRSVASLPPSLSHSMYTCMFCVI